NRAELHLHASGDEVGEIMFGRDGIDDANVKGSISARRGAAGAAPLYIYEGPYNTGSAWTSRLTILPGGNVGIGTTTPTSRLHVIGNFTASGTKSAIVETESYGMRKLYAIEAPDVRFMDVIKIDIEGEQWVEINP